jgi:hypothetical protein
VAKNLSSKIFFTQFHAEQAFQILFNGIRPEKQTHNQLRYKEKLGSFAEALNLF